MLIELRPAIFLMMIAFLLNFVTFILRISWLKFFPRPQWTMKKCASRFPDKENLKLIVETLC